MSQLFTNNATTTLATDLQISDTIVELATGFGALFPSPTGGDFFLCTVEDTSGNLEVLKCTARSSDDLTVVRAQENTSAQLFVSGSRVECRLTAGTFDNFLQKAGGVMDGELDLDNNVLRDPLITNGEIRNAPLRGSDGGTSNQIVVPTAGGAPTLGGNTIWHAGNDGDGSSLDADRLDGQEGSYYTGYAEDATNINTGTLDSTYLAAEVVLHDQKNGWTAGEYTTETDITATTTTTVNADLSNAFDIDLSTSITTFTLSNLSAGQSIVVLFRQSASNTVAFPVGWKWPDGIIPTVTTGAGAEDLLSLTNFNGTIFATLIQNFST
jgi:hypothetical protein